LAALRRPPSSEVIEGRRMPLERVLLYLTGAFVSACLGIGLLLVATSKQPGEIPATPEIEKTVPRPETAQTPPDHNESDHNEPTPQQKLDAMIAAAPEYDRFFDELRKNFPAEYAVALNDLGSRGADAAVRDIDSFVSEAVRNLRKTRGAAAAHAEAEPLTRIFDTQSAVLQAIAERDARLCVAFLYGGADLAHFSRFAATRRPLVADLAVAGLDAIANGNAKQIDRAEPSDADFKVLETALAAKGLSAEIIEALLDGKMPDPPLEDDRMCAAGQTYLETLRGLPEPVRLRIYGLAVELMARS
jgi:hypothetical protein